VMIRRSFRGAEWHEGEEFIDEGDLSLYRYALSPDGISQGTVSSKTVEFVNMLLRVELKSERTSHESL
jgi:hypothetical protein